MSLMHAWLMAVALTAPGTPSDLELVEFTATWCTPCRQMEPLMQQVRAQGISVTVVDVDQQVDLARKYGVSRVPTLLVVSGGQVVDRIEGSVTQPELWERLSRFRSPGSGASSPTDSDLASSPEISPRVARSPRTGARSPRQTDDRQAFEQRALAATVRIRVDDPDGHSFGSGTVVDAHQGEALVLTCGHIFRDSQGKGRIAVDLCGLAQPQTVAGELIRYDLERDVALVAIRSDVELQPIRVAGADYRVTPGQPLFSVGCNQGQDPTVLRGPLRAENQYLGPENLVVAGQPVDGRSGGGLFSYDGFLVGVCNAADPERAEGLYAAYKSVHRHLDEAKLAFIYQTRSPSGPAVASAALETAIDEDAELAAALATPAPRGGKNRKSSTEPSSLARSLPRISEVGPIGPPQENRPQQRAGDALDENESEAMESEIGRAAGLDVPQLARLQAEGAEVICIVRPRKDPAAKSQVFVLDRPSRGFLDQLKQEQTDQNHRQTTQWKVSRTRRLDTPR